MSSDTPDRRGPQTTSTVDEVVASFLDNPQKQAEALAKQAQTLIGESQFPKALDTIRKMVELDPNSLANAIYLWGWMAEADNEVDDALTRWTRAIALSPLNWEAFERRANLYEQNGLDLHALHDYTTLLEHHTNDRKFLEARVRLNLRQAALQGAAEAGSGEGTQEGAAASTEATRGDDAPELAFYEKVVVDLNTLIKQHASEVRALKHRKGLKVHVRKSLHESLRAQQGRNLQLRANCLEYLGKLTSAKADLKKAFSLLTGPAEKAELQAHMDRVDGRMNAIELEKAAKEQEKQEKGKKWRIRMEKQKYGGVVVYTPTRHDHLAWSKGQTRMDRMAASAARDIQSTYTSEKHAAEQEVIRRLFAQLRLQAEAPSLPGAEGWTSRSPPDDGSGSPT